MSMTRSQMNTLVKQGYGNRSDLDTHRTSWLNWALHDTASVRNWDDMIQRNREAVKTKVGQAYYPLPGRTKDIIRVIYRDGSNTCTLKYMQEGDFDLAYPNPSEAGNGYPTLYVKRGNEFQLHPQPSVGKAIIELHIALWPEDFDDTTDVESPLQRLDHALVNQAIAYAFSFVREWDQSQRYHHEWWKILRRAARAEGEPSNWQPVWGQSVRLQADTGVRKTSNLGD